MFTGRISLKTQWVSSLILVLPVMVSLSDWKFNEIIKDTIWALGFTGLIAFLLYLYQKGIRLYFLEKLKWLGDCSYTLYVIHFPILVFTSGLILKYNNNMMPQTFMFVTIFVIFIIVLSWALHLIIEKPFQRILSKNSI